MASVGAASPPRSAFVRLGRDKPARQNRGVTPLLPTLELAAEVVVAHRQCPLLPGTMQSKTNREVCQAEWDSRPGRSVPQNRLTRLVADTATAQRTGETHWPTKYALGVNPIQESGPTLMDRQRWLG